MNHKPYYNLLDVTFEGIAIHEDGTILEANDEYGKLFGYSRSEVIGKHVLDFAAPSSRDLVLQKIRARDEKPYEAVGLRKDKTNFHGELVAKESTYKDRHVRIVGLRDITGRKQLEEKLVERSVTKALEGFTVHVAHLINNPLAIISSNVQHLMDQLHQRDDRGVGTIDKEELLSVLDIIKNNCIRCANICKNLLTFGQRER